MGLMDRIEMRASVTFSPLDDFWYTANPGGSETWAGFPITPQKAMEVSTVNACISLIADIIARLPCILYKRRRDGGKDRATDHPLYARLARTPNNRQSRFRFFRYMARQLASRGNAYAEITNQLALLPIFPDRVQVEELDSGRARYLVTDSAGRQRPILQDAMLHLVDDGDDPAVGQARTILARQAIAVAAAAEQFAGRFFKHDATGRLLINKKGPVPDATKRAEYRQMLQENMAGSNNASRAFVNYGDAEITELGKQTDGAFIVDPRKHQATEICRYWRVQPFMIGLEDKITWGTNIEQIKGAFVDFTAMPWGINIEQELERALLDDNEREDYVIEFLYDALLRGDTLQRFSAYQIGRTIGVYSPDEIRAMENRNPREDGKGDEYLDTPTGAAPNNPQRRTGDVPPQAAKVPAPLLADAAARIAHSETSAVAARADKAQQDGARFGVWVRKFASAQHGSTVRVLTPLADAYGLPALAVTEAATRIERTMVAALDAGVPTGWCEGRAGEVAQIIEETFRAAARLQEAA